MNTEEMVDLELRMDKQVVAQYQKLTKKELLLHLYVAILKSHVQTETMEVLTKENTDLRNNAVSQREFDAKRHSKVLACAEEKLRQGEEYHEQARVMVAAVVDRWGNYDID